MVSAARQMAEKLASGANGRLVHESADILNKINQGESLAKICPREEISPLKVMQQIVDKWYVSCVSLNCLCVARWKLANPKLCLLSWFCTITIQIVSWIIPYGILATGLANESIFYSMGIGRRCQKKEYFRKLMEQIEVLLSVTTVLQIHKKDKLWFHATFSVKTSKLKTRCF